MTRVGVISDEFWAAVEPVMPSDEGRRGNRFSDHRLMLEEIAWWFRTGCPWRDLPTDFRPWRTVWKRHHRWSLDGTYDDMFAQVAAVFGVEGEMASLSRFLCKPEVIAYVCRLSEKYASGKDVDQCVECHFPAVCSG
uniref:transposase n=1 Tax=Amycolatopsis sp. cmx-11-51 TaxID=2785797 RepID=UPI0039E318B9